MRRLILAWAACFIGVVHSQSFFDILVSNDYRSLLSTVFVSVLGGVARTTWDLNDHRFAIPLPEIWSVARGNVVFAIITGLFAHLTLEALLPHWNGFTPAMRLLIVFSAGFSRKGLMGWGASTVKKAGDAATERIVSAVDAVKPKNTKPEETPDEH